MCCYTNRTHAFAALVTNTITNNSDSGLPLLPTLPSVDGSVSYTERDAAWLYMMVQNQFDIHPNWFEINTKYPINTTAYNNSDMDLIVEQSVNQYWYRLD